MTPEVSFDLERFGWVEEGRLEVIGRWSGLTGRRAARPMLTVAGRRLPAQPESRLEGDAWRAVFAWAGDPADVKGAELEVGRSLVVDLPPPRRLRRRTTVDAPAVATAAPDLIAARAEIDALREQLAARSGDDDDLIAARAEADALREQLAARSGDDDLIAARAEADALRKQLAAAAPDDSELAGLRLAHGSLRASHEQLEDELEALRGVRDERDAALGELEQLRSHGEDEERVKASLGDVIRELQERASESDAAREHLMQELTQARGEIAALTERAESGERELAEARSDAERRVETERATTTEVHSRLATAREEATRTMEAEAQETERLRAELETARDEAERLLAGERAEVARLREELITRGGAEEEATRRMVERIGRDLERERTTTRELRRELDDVRSETARHRRFESAATANGTTTHDEPPDRAVRTPERTRRRVDAARAASARRVPAVPPSAVSLWAVRIGAALVVAVLGIALVVLLSALT